MDGDIGGNVGRDVGKAKSWGKRPRGRVAQAGWQNAKGREKESGKDKEKYRLHVDECGGRPTKRWCHDGLGMCSGWRREGNIALGVKGGLEFS